MRATELIREAQRLAINEATDEAMMAAYDDRMEVATQLITLARLTRARAFRSKRPEGTGG